MCIKLNSFSTPLPQYYYFKKAIANTNYTVGFGNEIKQNDFEETIACTGYTVGFGKENTINYLNQVFYLKSLID